MIGAGDIGDVLLGELTMHAINHDRSVWLGTSKKTLALLLRASNVRGSAYQLGRRVRPGETMNTGWIISGVAALAVGAVAVPRHQGHGHRGPQIHHGGTSTQNHDRLIASLGLTAAQMDDLHGTLLSLHRDLFRLHLEPNVDAAQRSESIRSRHAKAEIELRRLLGSDRLAKFKSQGGLEGGHSAGALPQLAEQLSLTEAQRLSIIRIADQGLAEIGRVLGDGRLAREPRHKKVQVLHAALLQRFHEVLSSDQRERLHRLMQNAHGGHPN